MTVRLAASRDATLTATATGTPTRSPSRRSATATYVLIAFASLLIALLGFWPRYFGPMVAGTLETIPIIHVHAAVMMGWLFLLILQVVLIATGRRALHMKVGSVGMAWGVVVILVGWATAIVRFGERVQAGETRQAADRLFAPITDMMVFAPFLAAAWIYRRKPQIHKRLIVVASTVLLIAAVHRIRIFGGTQLPLPQLLLVWLSPILLGMTYDLVKTRRVHFVYLMGIGAVLFMKFGRVPLRDTGAWRSFSRWLATFYL